MAARGRQPAGMTLVEILVALSISVLILSVAVSIYLTVTRSLHRQQVSRQEPAYAALEQLRQDLAQCAQVPATNFPAFILKSEAQETNAPCLSSLAFSRGSLASSESDFSNMEVIRVGYNLMPARMEPGGRLVRDVTSLWGANALAPAVSNAILDHVTVFEVNVLSDSGWTNAWTASSRTLLPRAARIRMDWQTETSLETARIEVFIPAGNPVPGGKPAP